MSILSMEEIGLEEKRETRLADFDEIDAIFGLKPESIDSDVAVIILKIHQPAFISQKKSFDYHIGGKTLTEWVSLAFADCPVLEIECNEEDDVLSVVKPHLSEKRYTAVFYADTPLLKRETFLGILNYAKNKRMNVCKLERGFIFVTEYLRTAERIYSSVASNLEIGDDLLSVTDIKKFEYAQTVLKQRILGYHLERGVEILDLQHVSIDADVVIGVGSVIHPGASLLGKTSIGKNAVIYPNATIISSSIGDDCKIANSVVQFSKIRDNSEIMPFSFVLNGEVKNK